jgi:hypothetical protein
VVNEIAPPERRAEVTSVFFLAIFVGNSLPIIGVGILDTLFSPLIASAIFTGTIAAFAFVALVAQRRSG